MCQRVTKTPFYNHPRFRPPPVGLIRNKLPPSLRGRYFLAAVIHRYNQGHYLCVFERKDGSRFSIPVRDPRQGWFFKLDNNVCRAVARVFRRGSGLRPKVDAWTLVGLWSLASKIPEDQRKVVQNKLDEPGGLRIAFKPSLLLREIGVLRRKAQAEGGLPDFERNDWRALKQSLRRLASVPVEFNYSIRLRDRRKKPEKRLFVGSLITADLPEGQSRGPCVVVLNVCDGIFANYYVLVSRYLFELRTEVGELDTRILFELVARHRGKMGKKRFGHNWKMTIDLDRLAGPDDLRLPQSHPAKAMARIQEALERLLRIGVLDSLSVAEDRATLDLSPEFFHEENL